ncbi:putative letm1-like protein [Erysiphe neolycopersici]|uniref:Putative letm1-like protein n=1 Tax=Erysiphe neolycopersici TaxID=212602 RepID=A0A420I3R0_9PEZI|nr:putative letm1-like protein [Erysiphe neolycopersici]
MSLNRIHRVYFQTSYRHRISLDYKISSIKFQRFQCVSNLSLANGPLTTLPTELKYPDRKVSQNIISHYFRVGKAYLQFYKAGVKNIYHNYKASLPIQELIDSQYEGSVSQAINANAISRSDFQLLTRNWHDLKRVPLFGLIFAVCGEFTPLIVMALGNIVPLTCRTPAQITRERKRLERSRRRAFQQVATQQPIKAVSELGSKQLIQISISLGLSSKIWSLLGGPPAAILRSKVKKRLEYFGQDDRLIEIAGGVQNMSTEEVEMALVVRGIDVLGRAENELRYDLESWLKLRGGVSYSYERLLLTRQVSCIASRPS